jgi:hypothetical protein
MAVPCPMIEETYSTVQAPSPKLASVPPPEPFSAQMQEWIGACKKLAHQIAWRYRWLDDDGDPKNRHAEVFSLVMPGLILAARLYRGDSLQEFKSYAYAKMLGEITRERNTRFYRGLGLHAPALHERDDGDESEAPEVVDEISDAPLELHPAAFSVLNANERTVIEMRYGFQRLPDEEKAKLATNRDAVRLRRKRAVSAQTKRAKGERGYACFTPHRIIAKAIGKKYPFEAARIEKQALAKLRVAQSAGFPYQRPSNPFGGCASVRQPEAQCLGCKFIWVKRLGANDAEIRADVAEIFRDASRAGRGTHTLVGDELIPA